jgi:hypothetical protein
MVCLKLVCRHWPIGISGVGLGHIIAELVWRAIRVSRFRATRHRKDKSQHGQDQRYPLACASQLHTAALPGYCEAVIGVFPFEAENEERSPSAYFGPEALALPRAAFWKT